MPALPRVKRVASGIHQAGLVEGSLPNGPLHRLPCPPPTVGGSMKTSRPRALSVLGSALAGLLSTPAARASKTAVQKLFVSSQAPKGYDPTKHKWLMVFDVDKCIGCGHCVEACKEENNVPKGSSYFRTWIE